MKNISIDKIEDLSNLNSENINEVDSILINVTDEKAGKQKFVENIEKVYSNLNSLLSERKSTNNIDITFCMNNDDFMSDDLLMWYNEFDDLKKFNTNLRLRESAISTLSYSFSEVMDAQVRAQKLVSPIINSKASELEKYLAVYDIVTDQLYKESENKAASRDLVNVLNQKEYRVCVGYADMLTYLCKLAGIKCITQEVMANAGYENHARNVVVINDEKYKVNICRSADSCWDSIIVDNNGNKYTTLHNSLVLFEDVGKHKTSVQTENKSLEVLYSKNINELYGNIINNFYTLSFEQPEIEIYKTQGDVLDMFGISNKQFDVSENKRLCAEIVDDKQRLIDAVNLLKNKFKEYGIDDQIYGKHTQIVFLNGKSSVLIPRKNDLYSLLALCLTNPPAEDMLDTNLQELKEFQLNNQPTANDEIFIEKNLSSLVSGDIKNDDYIFSKFKLQGALFEAMEAKYITEQMATKLFNDEISIDKLIEAQKQAYIIRGYSKEEAEEKTRIKMLASTVFGNSNYISGAKNCFKTTTIEEMQAKFNNLANQY